MSVGYMLIVSTVVSNVIVTDSFWFYKHLATKSKAICVQGLHFFISKLTEYGLKRVCPSECCSYCEDPIMLWCRLIKQCNNCFFWFDLIFLFFSILHHYIRHSFKGPSLVHHVTTLECLLCFLGLSQWRVTSDITDSVTVSLSWMEKMMQFIL